MLSENIIKGSIIELKVQEELLRYGFDISIPSFNSSKYDILVDTGKEFLRIQVKKSIGKTNNSFTFECTTQNVKSSTGSKHKYTKDEVDYFATVWKDKVYLIPLEETSQSKTLQLVKNQYGNYAEDYLAENILKSYSRISDEELYNYSSKGKNYCCDCGCEILTTSERCVACKNKIQRTVERPSREELKSLIRTLPFTQIGKQFNVSDNAIRKWCYAEGLPAKKSEINNYSEEDWSNL